METLANAKIIPLRKLSFEYAIRPVYYFSRLTGQWPFSVIHDPNGTLQRARVGFFDILWPILMMCLNLILSLDSYDQLKGEQEKNVIRIRSAVEYLLDMCSFLFVAIGIVLGVINCNKIVDILRKFKAFDNEVRHFFVKPFQIVKPFFHFE